MQIDTEKLTGLIKQEIKEIRYTPGCVSGSFSIGSITETGVVFDVRVVITELDYAEEQYNYILINPQNECIKD